MSWRYPHKDGGRNAEANRARQRYSHTMDYHTRHQMREQAERAESLRAARGERAGASPTDPERASKPSVAAGATGGAGMLAAAGEFFGALTVPQIVVGVVVVVAAGYGAYRLVKWARRA